MPQNLVLGLIDPSAFSGDFSLSSVRFERHELTLMEVKVDAQPIQSHPLRMDGENCSMFFTNYLISTNRFMNPHSGGSLTYEDFHESNFLVYTNLKDQNYEQGQLTIKLQFKNVLPKKLFLVYIPIYERKIIFDSYFNVQVHQ